MDLHTITAVRPIRHLDEVEQWKPGYAWLGGGTWLFSEPQPHTDTLLDLATLEWPDVESGENGLSFAGTCLLVKVDEAPLRPEWEAGWLVSRCVRSLLASFKIWNTATIGGNICMSLPAGALIALTVGLEGTYTLVSLDGSERTVPAEDFVTGNHQNILRKDQGEVLRLVHIPATALVKKAAFRKVSLTHQGRSAALLIGTLCPATADFRLTVTAATTRPHVLRLDHVPSREELSHALRERFEPGDWFDDVNGTPEYKHHMTHYLAEQIRQELAGEIPATHGVEIP